MRVVRLNVVRLNVIRLNVIRLNVDRLNVVRLNVVMLNVVAPILAADFFLNCSNCKAKEAIVLNFTNILKY